MNNEIQDPSQSVEYKLSGLMLNMTMTLVYGVIIGVLIFPLTSTVFGFKMSVKLVLDFGLFLTGFSLLISFLRHNLKSEAVSPK